MTKFASFFATLHVYHIVAKLRQYFSGTVEKNKIKMNKYFIFMLGWRTKIFTNFS